MVADLHNHTPLCKHAKGKPREYVEKAIENGCKYFGFSDHAPMDFDREYRMSFDDMRSYEEDVKRLKEHYKNDIEILLGYEVDFIEKFLDERVLKADVDYLIGSVHFLDGWGFDNPEFMDEYKKRDIDKIYQDYFEAIRLMAKSSKFQIVGHLDLIKVFGYRPKKDVRLIAKDAIKAIKEADMTVEISSAGVRKPVKEIYPSRELLKEISQNDIPITFASDAHHPKQVGFKSDEIVELAREFGYNKCAIFRQKERVMVNF
jgi:histidinol-phosphatase (PHP family)